MEKPLIHEYSKQIYLFENVDLVLHSMSTVQNLCAKPYYNNPNGCPNLSKFKKGCPPHVLHISKEYDLNTIHMLLVQFPFFQYITEKRETHPTWNNRELINTRHWQGHLKCVLNQYWDNHKEIYPNHIPLKNPEAQGVNIQKTLENYNIHLQWPKQDEEEQIYEVPEYMYHVYLLGEKL